MLPNVKPLSDNYTIEVFILKRTAILLCILLLFLCGCQVTFREVTQPEPTLAPTLPTEPAPTQTVPTEPEPTETVSGFTSVEKLLAGMTTEEKVGQLFLVRCPKENDVQDISKYHLGGFMLFGKDFQDRTAEQVQIGRASCRERV